MCGTPAKEVTPARVARSQSAGQVTDSSVSTTDAPASRWLVSTERP